MDPKLQLVTGCALVAFFSHTNVVPSSKLGQGQRGVRLFESQSE